MEKIDFFPKSVRWIYSYYGNLFGALLSHWRRCASRSQRRGYNLVCINTKYLPIYYDMCGWRFFLNAHIASVYIKYITYTLYTHAREIIGHACWKNSTRYLYTYIVGRYSVLYTLYSSILNMKLNATSLTTPLQRK